MTHFLIVTSNEHKFSEFTNALTSENTVETSRAASSKEALDAISGAIPDLVIIDEEVGGTPGLEIARSILMKNAMVNQAVVSRLSSEEFHEVSEGLGILAQLSLEPDAAQAKTLLDLLKKMP
ncbi:MAG: response regulator transcription factor [Desulfobacteraceae bacterium]|nr:response regulator transcription factor [Desulfobacteraceae bacterium]MBC2754993.1 response regulator transcription factor [Desulfobacteraceae bacterium]